MKLEEMKLEALFDASHTIAQKALADYTYPWEVLPHIKDIIMGIGQSLPQDEYRKIGDNIWIHKRAKVAPTICMGGPAIICERAEVRHCAFFRGCVIVGAGAVIGNSVEVKNSIIFDKAQVPHFNYVGDSILGYHAHMGAGAITSNVKADKTLVKIHGDEEIETGLKKVGAFLGDYAEIGCNSVLNPGTVIGRNTTVYPLSSVRGCVAGDSIYKAQGSVSAKEAREEPESEAGESKIIKLK